MGDYLALLLFALIPKGGEQIFTALILVVLVFLAIVLPTYIFGYNAGCDRAESHWIRRRHPRTPHRPQDWRAERPAGGREGWGEQTMTREDAERLVRSTTRCTDGGMKYVKAGDAKRLIEVDATNAGGYYGLISDPLRKHGPLPNTYYPWNVVDWMTTLELAQRDTPEPSGN
ncbi:MAG: hypothetical protein AAGF31_13575 [Planctomycetota bacterium]